MKRWLVLLVCLVGCSASTDQSFRGVGYEDQIIREDLQMVVSTFYEWNCMFHHMPAFNLYLENGPDAPSDTKTTRLGVARYFTDYREIELYPRRIKERFPVTYPTVFRQVMLHEMIHVADPAYGHDEDPESIQFPSVRDGQILKPELYNRLGDRYGFRASPEECLDYVRK